MKEIMHMKYIYLMAKLVMAEYSKHRIGASTEYCETARRAYGAPKFDQITEQITQEKTCSMSTAL
jgi:hypothetical protein